MRELIWHLSVIILIGGAIFFTNLGQARLWDRDEPRNAGCAAEMLARGDWVVPTFNDELRHQKPVLLYWLMMSAYSVLGVNEFSARVWSAGLALVTTIATYGIARRLISPRVGLLAAIALMSSLMFDVAARAATPDSVLICCTTSAIYLYVIGTFVRKPVAGNSVGNGQFQVSSLTGSWFPGNVFLVIAIYALLGLGVLAKGPVGFLLPMATIGMFMLVARLNQASQVPDGVDVQVALFGKFLNLLRPFHPWHFLKTLWSMRPLLAVSVIFLIAAPWYFMVAKATDGMFIEKFFVGEHFGRATTVLESHRGGLWFYPAAILIGFFPWSVLWGPVVVNMIWGGRRKTILAPIPVSNGDSSEACSVEPVGDGASEFNYANVLMLSWIGIQVGAFSLAQTKLPSYVTPCYPALAILAAVCLNELSTNRITIHRGWFYAAFGGLALSGMAICGGLGFATMKFLPNQFWLAALGLTPLIAGSVLVLMLMRQRKKYLPLVFSISSVVFCWILFGFGTVSIDGEQESHLVLGEIESQDAAVASFGCLESSWVFYGGKPILEIELEDMGDDSEPKVLFDLSGKTMLHAPPAVVKVEKAVRKYWQPKQSSSVEAFLKQNPGAVFLTTSEHLETLKQRLPSDYGVIESAEYFLKNKTIYLLGQKLSADFEPRVYYTP